MFINMYRLSLFSSSLRMALEPPTIVIFSNWIVSGIIHEYVEDSGWFMAGSFCIATSYCRVGWRRQWSTWIDRPCWYMYNTAAKLKDEWLCKGNHSSGEYPSIFKLVTRLTKQKARFHSHLYQLDGRNDREMRRERDGCWMDKEFSKDRKRNSISYRFISRAHLFNNNFRWRKRMKIIVPTFCLSRNRIFIHKTDHQE